EARLRGIGRPLVVVELARPVHSPGGGVGRLLGHLHEAHIRIPGLLLALEDVREQRRDAEQGETGRDEEEDEPRDALHPRAPWPTPRWQWTHSTASEPVVLPRTMSCTKSPWQRRQFSWRIAAFFALIRIGSWKSCNVNPFEWW